MSFPLSEGQWKKSHLTVRRWESERRFPQPRNHRWLAVGSIRQVGARADGQWCSWTTTRRWGRYAICTEHWMQRLRCGVSSKRAELTAFSCAFSQKSWGPTTVHVDNYRIFDGLWRGEMRCIGQGRRFLWILIWEELHRVHQEGIVVEVEHEKRIVPRGTCSK